MQDDTRSRIILMFGVFGVTSSSFIIKFAEQPPYILAGVRVLLTGILAFVILSPDKSLNISRRDTGKIILAGFSLATHFGWWFDSLSYLPVGTSLSLTNTAPVWMAIIMLIIFGQQLKRRQQLSIVFVILGSVSLFMENGIKNSQGVYGLILALGSAIGFAIYLVLAREMVPKLGLWKYFGLVNLSSAFFLFIYSDINGEVSQISSPNLWLFGLLLALIPGISGHAIYNWAIPKLDTIDVGVATLGEPILGTVVAWLILGEHLNLLEGISISFLIVAIGFTIDRKSRSSTFDVSTVELSQN